MTIDSVKKNSTKCLRRFTISPNDRISFSKILLINSTLDQAIIDDHIDPVPLERYFRISCQNKISYKFMTRLVLANILQNNSKQE